MSQVSQRIGTLEEIKELTSRLQEERTMHLEAAATLEKSLQTIRDEVTKLLNNSEVATPESPPVVIPEPAPAAPAKKSAKTKKSDSRVGNTRSRNGAISGTQKIVNILVKNNKKMEAKALREEASKQGVKNPHSALQSLTRSKTVKMVDGTITLQA